MADRLPESSDLVERASVEDLTESPDRPAPMHMYPSTPRPDIPFTVITIPHSPSPLLSPPPTPPVEPLSIIPHPSFRPTIPPRYTPSYLVRSSASFTSTTPLPTHNPNPCPVTFHPLPPSSFPPRPLPLSRVDGRIRDVALRQKHQLHSMRCTCIALTLLTLITLTAFIAAAYYFTHSLHPAFQTIDTPTLSDASVTTPKLSPLSISPSSLSPALDAALLALNSSFVQALALLPTAGAGLQLSGVRTVNVLVDGTTLWVAGNSTLTIAIAGLNSSHLAPASITPIHLTTGAVTAPKLAADAVTMENVGADVRGKVEAVNATATAVYAMMPSAGVGMELAGSEVGLVLDGAYLTLSPAGQLTIAPASLDASLFRPSSLYAVSLSPSVMSHVPQAGAGLSSLYFPFNSTVFTVSTDGSSVLLSGDGVLTVGQVEAEQLSAGCVTSTQLGGDVVSAMAELNATALEAVAASVELAASQAALQQQLLQAVGLEQSDVLYLADLSSAQLLDAVLRINATTFSAAAAVNSSVSAHAEVVGAEVDSVHQQMSVAYRSLISQLPLAGLGISLSNLAQPALSVRADPRYFAYASNALTLQPSSIDAAVLASSAVTSSKLATASVTTAAVTDGSVAVQHLTANLSRTLQMMSASGTTLTLGMQGVDVTLTRPAGGDLIIAAANSNGVSLQSANGSSLSVSADGAEVTASTLTVATTGQGGVQMTGQSLAMSAANLSLTSSLASLSLNGTNLSLASPTTTVQAQTLQLQSHSTNLTSPHISIAASMRYVPQLVDTQTADSVYVVDLSNLTSPSLRITGAATNLSLAFIGCSDAYAGRSLSVFNQLTSSISISASSCSRTNVLTLLSMGRVTVTCAGLYNAVPVYDCQQGEQPAGGVRLTSSSPLIVGDVVSGVASSVGVVGVLQLSFVPVSNANPVLSFLLSSPLFKEGSTAVQVTAVSSGVTNAVYAGDKLSPAWVVAGQVLDVVGGSVAVTMVNVGDPLYAGQTQLLQFLYRIL